MLELFAEDAFSRKAEAITIEAERSIEVIDAEGNDCNAWLHLRVSQEAQRPAASAAARSVVRLDAAVRPMSHTHPCASMSATHSCRSSGTSLCAMSQTTVSLIFGYACVS